MERENLNNSSILKSEKINSKCFPSILKFEALNAEADNVQELQNEKVKVGAIQHLSMSTGLETNCEYSSVSRKNEEDTHENDLERSKNYLQKKFDTNDVINHKDENEASFKQGKVTENSRNLSLEWHGDYFHSSDDDTSSPLKISDGENTDLPQLKRRIWSPSKKMPVKRNYINTESTYNNSVSNNSDNSLELENRDLTPKKNRRKQLHPDRSIVQPSWEETHQPYIEFENSRMFLKFRRDQDKFKCKKCNIECGSQDYLIAHDLSCKARETNKSEDVGTEQPGGSEEITYEQKSDVKISVDDLLQRQLDENKMVKCKYCQVTFPSLIGVQRHTAFKHKKELAEDASKNDANADDSPNIFICVLCGRNLKSKTLLVKHWQVHLESKEFKCDLCEKEFSHKQSLEIHKMSHQLVKENFHTRFMFNSCYYGNSEVTDPEYNESCGNNDQSAASSSDSLTLRDIYFTQNDQDGKISFHCKNCLKGYSSKNKLITHLATGCLDRSHKPQKCPVCDKILKTSVADHIRIHTGERPFECSVCGKMFKRGYHLQIHKQTAHSDEKPWMCDEPGCTKSFKRKDKLQCHKRTHSSEKPYTCTECGNAYKQSHHLNRHKKRAHGQAKVMPMMRPIKDKIVKKDRIENNSKRTDFNVCEKDSVENNVIGNVSSKDSSENVIGRMSTKESLENNVIRNVPTKESSENVIVRMSTKDSLENNNIMTDFNVSSKAKVKLEKEERLEHESKETDFNAVDQMIKEKIEKESKNLIPEFENFNANDEHWDMSKEISKVISDLDDQEI